MLQRVSPQTTQPFHMEALLLWVGNGAVQCCTVFPDRFAIFFYDVIETCEFYVPRSAPCVWGRSIEPPLPHTVYTVLNDRFCSHVFLCLI